MPKLRPKYHSVLDKARKAICWYKYTYTQKMNVYIYVYIYVYTYTCIYKYICINLCIYI